MKNIICIISLLCFALLSSAQMLRPEVIGSYGGTDTSNYRINYTIGQTLALPSSSGSGIQLSQGFHQSNLEKEVYDLTNCETPDSLPCYNIGEIATQTVYSGVPLAFYVWSHELGMTAERSIEMIAPQPNGKVKFSNKLGKFSFTPSDIDRGRYTIIFKAISGIDTVWQEAYFDVIPFLAPEQTAFGLESNRSLPAADSDEFTVITQTETGTKLFNHQNRKVYDISIAGKTLIFDKNIQNSLYTFCETKRSDIEHLNIYAEHIVVRSPLHFPQTKVTIHARTFRFEDIEGTVSSINTKPDDPTVNQTNRLDGLQAGSITLHIQDFKSSFSKRFQLIGGDGHKGGNGGNGGVFSASLALKDFALLTGGNADSNAASAKRGALGRFELLEAEHTWLHPYALKMIVAHGKAAYLNNYMNYTQEVFDEYSLFVEAFKTDEEWATLSEDEQLELEQSQQEMGSVLHRIGSNLDYFGNPAGWVPMLSFEVNKLAFEEEVERSLRILYFTYWIQKIDENNTQKIALLRNARSEQKDALLSFQDAYEEASTLLPQLEAEADDIVAAMQTVQRDIETLEQELTDRAKYVVEERHKPPKKSWWQKGLSAIGSIAKVVPIYQPALGAIGTGLTTLSEIDTSKPLEAAGKVVSAVNTFRSADFAASAKDFESKLDALDDLDIDVTDPSKLKDYYKSISSTAKPIYNAVLELNKKVGETKVPLEEIQVELEKLKATSPEFTDLVNKANELMMQKAGFEQKITVTIQKIAQLGNDIQTGVLAIDGMNVQLFNANSKRDLRAMLYVKDMEARTKERLMKYHYYMAKAYEYRLLEPYEAALNLPDLFDRFKEIMATDTDTELTATEFEQLGAIYDEVIAVVTEEILDKYNQDAPELQVPIRYDLTAEDLAMLNDGKAVHLNMIQRSLFPAQEENIRIVDFEITNIEMHFEGGTPGNLAYFDLTLEHSGISRLKKGGEVYLFNHYNNENRNPIIWSARYDARNNTIDPKKPSPSNESLLRSLLIGLNRFNDENLVMYSRPAAWADIIINKTDVTDNGVKMVIDRVQCKITYDFQQISSDFISLEVRTNSTMKPYIEVSEMDVNERQDGWGDFSRTYNKSLSRRVQLTAPQQYGSWVFQNWTDFFGNVASEDHQIQIDLANDRTLQANYVLIQPKLFLPKDTIYLSATAGIQAIEVQNAANGTLDWKVSKDVDWIDFRQGATGTNNDSIAMTYDANLSENERTAYLSVVAPASVRYKDTIVIIQERDTTGIRSACALLEDFYYATTGENWTINTDWLSDCDPCGAVDGTPWYGITCDANDKVTRILLQNNNLTGSLPATIGGFEHLQILDLRNNSLGGTLPTSLSNLSKLEFLQLQQNGSIHGVIPPSLGNLKQLKFLRLEGNQLTGGIPEQIGNLMNLEFFGVSNNFNLGGIIPSSLAKLSKLQYLYLRNCQLSGSLPAALGDLSQLAFFWVDRNQLTGGIPASFSKLVSLQNLKLFSNHLSGCYPPDVQMLCTNLADQSTNANISVGNTFDATWEDFCNFGMGQCGGNNSNLISTDTDLENAASVQVYPNPFSDETTIEYQLLEEQRVSIQILDVTGRLVETLVPQQSQSSGQYRVYWQAQQRQAGIYFLQISIGDQRKTQKLMLVE
ncbi:MAG: T9SS type A sorting domain-containing protein [Bacteroidota bacterium]